jgi:hypothetical protein
MKQILFTFDYELYLGERSGSVSKCLIEPTKKILDIFGYKKLKLIFFVDTTYLLRLREIAEDGNRQAENDLEEIKTQLIDIVKQGHYVFPHLHPHWLDAEYLPHLNQWDLRDVTRYSFKSLSLIDRKKMFQDSMTFLSELIHSARPEFRIEGYRAGGWSIQPICDFLEYFKEYGIKYDFTVVPGIHCRSSAQDFDFRTELVLPGTYTFNENVIQPEPGPFREFTISTIPAPGVYENLKDRVLLKLVPEKLRETSGDGLCAVQNTLPEEKEVAATLQHLDVELATFDTLNMRRAKMYSKLILESNFVQFISHPKMLSRYNFRLMENFLNKICLDYSVESDYQKMIFD